MVSVRVTGMHIRVAENIKHVLVALSARSKGNGTHINLTLE